MTEAEDWNIAVEVYAGDPSSALLLAYQLIAIKQAIKRGRKGISDAIESLDLALDSLYPHTDFYRVSHQFYHHTIEGILSPTNEAKLRELGIKF